MGRRPCCEMSGVKKGPWSPEEDLLLVSYVQDHGAGNWRAVPTNTGLMRCSKSCRLRWTNYLRPGIKRGNFSDQEDKLIIELQKLLGNRWSVIASHMPERTDNDIKNYWNTHLKKKLTKTKGDGAAAPTNKGVSEEALSMDTASPAIKLQPLPPMALPTPDISPAMYASSIDNIAHLLKAKGWMGPSASGKASAVSPVSDDGEARSGSHSGMTRTLEGFTEMTKVEGSGGVGLGPSSSFSMMESWLLDDGLGHSDAGLIGMPLADLFNFI